MKLYKYPTLTIIEKDDIVAAAGVKGMNADLAEKYGVSIRSIQEWKRKIMTERNLKPKAASKQIINSDKLKISKLEKENKLLKRAVDEAKHDIISSTDVKELIAGVREIGFEDEIPEWVNTTEKSIVPVICLSDIHIGEVVEEGDVGFGDSFNTELAHSYADKVINDFVGICKHNMNYDYEGVVLILGGDIIAGNNMHNMDETNDRTATEQVVEGVNLIIRSINTLHKEFGKVFVPAVTGNHDRLDGSRYTRTKQRTENSLGSMVYYFVQQHFRDNEDVVIVTDKSDEILFSVNGHRFNLQHGDTIKGGNGIGGVAVPILRARAKKLTAAVAVGKAFDTLIIGHFHQSIHLTGLIVMNSLKIYDEYSKMLGFSYSRPGGTSFFINEHGEIIYSSNIIIRKESEIIKAKKSIELF
jgi:hypothetical protein